MIIGYTLYAADNKSYFYKKTFCDKCLVCGGTILNDSKPYLVDLKRKKLDISFTYDGKLIVSKVFRSFILENNIKDVSFIPIKNQSEYFLFESYKIIKFDIEKRGTKFINKCDECEEYYEIIGATPVFLKNNEEISQEGIFRTDQIFGTGISKHPVYMVGLTTYEKIINQNFKGIDLAPIKL